MTDNDGKKPVLRGFAPRGTRGIISIAVVFVLAFVLGGLILGRGGAPTDDRGGDATNVATTAPDMWTCSMHPQIKLPAPGKCPICFMDLIPVTTDTGEALGPRQLRMSETARQLAQIQTTAAVRAFAEAKIRMVGKVAYDESKLAYITAWVPGRLERLFADYTGVQVEKGDHLVRMYSPELLAAQEELIQAQAAVTALDATTSQVLRSTAKATLEAAREKLRLFGLTAQQVKTIEETHRTTDQLTIYAPIGGVVVHKDAREGMYVSTGTRIYTIADLGKLWVMFEAYESDLPWLRFGQRVEFTSTSFPGERFEAAISFIDPLVDPKTRTVKVRAIVDNKDGRLKPDMFVRGVVHSSLDGRGSIIDDSMADKWICPMHPEVVKDKPGPCDICEMDIVPAASLGYVVHTDEQGEPPILIPATAPLVTGTRAVVYVEVPNDEGPLYEGREVELGPRAGNYYVVKSGIEEGELVVSNGAFKIDSELQIQAKPSMMSPEGGATPAGHKHPSGDGSASRGAAGEGAGDGATDPRGGGGRAVGDGEVHAALSPVYAAYFDMQMALARDDLAGAKAAATAMTRAVKGVDMSLFTGKAHDRWMELSKTLSERADAIAKSDEAAAARDAFYYVSQATISLLEDFGHAGGGDYYLTYCPMARSGDGAWWVQSQGEVVWNSYYGARMLRCGSVEKTVAAAGKK